VGLVSLPGQVGDIAWGYASLDEKQKLHNRTTSMVDTRKLWAGFAAMLLIAPLATRAATDPGDAALAERYCTLAQNVLRTRDVAPDAYRRSAALLEAATRLNPTEPRFARLLIEAQLYLKDGPAAIAALQAYRKIAPDDQTAQTRLIDLYTGSMETAEKKIAYLRSVIMKQGVPAEVRSHAAYVCAGILLDRSQNAESDAMLTEAIRSNPLNLAALKKRYSARGAGQPAFERLSALLAMLLVNPAQLDVATSLAELLAEKGLYTESLAWYAYSSQLSQRLRTPLTPAFGVGYATTYFCMDQPASAEQIVASVLKADAGNVDAWFLRLILDRKSGSPDALKADGVMALNAIFNQLASISKAAGDEGATTRPVNSPDEPSFPDFVDAIQKIDASTRTDLQAGYRDALRDLAWYYLFVSGDGDRAQPVIDALKSRADAGDIKVSRLEGWRFLLAGKFDEARQKLTAIADRDAMAMLGLLRVPTSDDSQKQKNAALARQLVLQHPSGLTGAAIWAELAGQTPRVEPDQTVLALRDEVRKFPTGWLKILDVPHEFYLIRAEPLSVNHAFGQPMLVRLYVQNISEFDLAIGPDGVLKQDLWIDASTRGVTQQQFPGIAYDRIDQQLVLKPKQMITQIVRVDQGQLGEFLAGAPQLGIPVFGTLSTNPSTSGRSVGPGVGGYRVQFLRVMDRSPAVLSGEESKTRIYDQIEQGDAGAKIAALELLGTYTLVIRGSKGTQELAPLANEFADRVGRSVNPSESAAVRAWANYVHVLLLPPDQRREKIERALRDDDWRVRLTGTLLLAGLPPDEGMLLAQREVKAESDATVRAFATALVESLSHPSTRPATTTPDDPK